MDATEKQLWVGWLCGDEADRERFEEWGVHGPMMFREQDNSTSLTESAQKKTGVFEHCWVTPGDYAKLQDGYDAFYRKAFALLEEDELDKYLDAAPDKNEKEAWR